MMMTRVALRGSRCWCTPSDLVQYTEAVHHQPGHYQWYLT
jgi:hypothetical protein